MFQIEAILPYISLGSHLLPLLLFLIYLKRNKRKDVRVIFFYCLYAFLNDTILLNEIPIKNFGFVLLSLFTVIEYSLFSLLIYGNLKNRIFRQIILWVSPIFIAFSIFQFLTSDEKAGIDSITITVEYILLIVYCLFYFFEELNEPKINFIYSAHTFWIIIGILIYSTGTFFFFMNSADLTDEQWDKWSAINYVGTIIKNAFFSVAMVLKKAEPPESSPPFDNKFDGFEKPITPL